VESILLDRKRVLPCCAYLQGEYGIEGAYTGVPVLLGAGGVERVYEAPLAPDELDGLRRAADAVRELVALIK